MERRSPEGHPAVGGEIGALVEENLRLYRAVRDGAGPTCTKPWVSFEVRSSLGQVKPCCWFRGRLGHVRDESDVETIWNGESYRALRGAMSVGRIPQEC